MRQKTRPGRFEAGYLTDGDKKRRRLARRRPAEKVGLSGALIVVVGRVLGVDDPDVLALAAAALGMAPAVIASLIANGGVVGAFRSLLFGRK